MYLVICLHLSFHTSIGGWEMRMFYRQGSRRCYGYLGIQNDSHGHG